MNNLNLPVIPETITVHLGPAGSPARNVTVPFVDYIKNVASSEIYPTWPETAIRANVLAQISFALNRVYTEYYRSRGYDNISRIVDDIFNDYIRRQGSVAPLFAQYCDGVEVSCGGLSQWGSVNLSEQGYAPYQILQFYYGDNIELVQDAPIMGITESYPGIALRPGTSGNEIRRIQVRLNRISRNYPSIPKIPVTDGIYGPDTEAAVREFQRIFGLTEDGIIGRSTWYAIERIYNAVKRLSELNAEGLTPDDVRDVLPRILQEGDTGTDVRELQYLLAFVGNFTETLPVIAVDGVFGPTTRQAVEQFQQQQGLEPSGIVDTVTWNRLYNTYRSLYESLPENYFSGATAPYPGTPLSRGSRGAEVTRIQEYLNYISNTYPSIPKLDADGVFGARTAEAVRAYQTLFGIEPSGIVGAATWESITETYRDLFQGAQASGTQFGGEIG